MIPQEVSVNISKWAIVGKILVAIGFFLLLLGGWKFLYSTVLESGVQESERNDAKAVIALKQELEGKSRETRALQKALEVSQANRELVEQLEHKALVTLVLAIQAKSVAEAVRFDESSVTVEDTVFQFVRDAAGAVVGVRPLTEKSDVKDIFPSESHK